jgi:(2Fe-2S) ferredoxin
VGDSAPAPRKKRIVLCMGQHCNQGGQAQGFYDRLRQALGDLGPAWSSPRRVRWEIANCFSMCDDGPNLVVYPEGTCYHHLDKATLEQILESCLKD